MNVSYAAKALGGDLAGRNNVLCPGPGHSRRDRSLSVTFTGDDFAVFSHAGDDWRACKDHVRERLGLGDFTPAKTRSAVIVTPTPEDRDRIERAGTLWREARPIEGTPAVAYLASRGVSYQGEALRWHPSCPFGKGERHGCMIALVRNIVTNEPQAIHRTAIDASGRKIDRKAYGPIGGGAVKLTDDANVTKVIAIGEGIETALSIRELPDLGNMPVWPVLSANGIAAFPVLPGIESVWIAADNDASGTGQNAARSAGERLHAAGVETIILAPTQAGADLNDKVARRV
jgi:putative DNA primase/helicase